MCKFQSAENKGRKLLSKFLKDLDKDYSIQFTGDKYNSADAYLKLGDKNIIVEIKVRDEKVEQYNTHFIEESKVDRLKQIKKELNADGILYFSFFGDNILYVYNLEKCRYKKSSVYCGRTSVVYSGDVTKSMYEIYKDSGKRYINVNNKWIK